MPEISIQGAHGSSGRFVLSKERVTIGRSRDSDIFLADQWLSRQHAEIRMGADGYALLDLGSKNGTLLNGERLREERLLRNGDVITLGEHLLTFSAEQADEVEEDEAPMGTRVFSARELSDVVTKPSIDPAELARQNRVLAVLSQAANKLLPLHLPLPDLFEYILNLLFDAIPAERAAILLLEGIPAQPVISASRTRTGKAIAKVSRSIARKVLEEKVSLLLPNVMEDAAFRSQDSILSTGIRSAMCAPLWFRAAQGDQDTVIGLLYVDSLQASHSFGEEDMSILTALGNVAAAKIENVRLLEESLEKRVMEEDMRTAREIQNGLLPGIPPELPGYTLSGCNHSCRAVGGDYYDFALRDDQLLLALGDVSGKGTGAALLMAVLRAAVRSHWNDPRPSLAIERINETICQNVPSNRFVTFFLARLDVKSGRLTYINAGHNPPLLLRASGETEMLQTGGMILGVSEGFPYQEGIVTIAEGDALVIYSDGVTETWNARGEEFGEARLIDVAHRSRQGDAAFLQAEILRELEVFASSAKATDDRTLVVLRRHR